jgi:Tol biopolymer transport system component
MRAVMIRLPALLVGVGLVLALAAIPAQATFPGRNGKIVFEREGVNGDQSPLYTVNPDGSADTLLASQGHSPTWSASGSRLAFACHNAICIADASGNTIAQYWLGQPGFDYFPAWSPDGSQIAFQVLVPVHFSPPPEIWKVNADGTGAARVAEGGIPDWSPDGSRIAFQDSGIKVMNTDGSGITPPLTSQGNFASWSPDGSRIAFDNGAGDIYTVKPDGSELTRIGPGYQPVWSPDGTKIAFEGTDGTSFGIFVMNAEGTSPVLIAEDGALPDWQPLRGPQRSDYQNAARFCNAERDFLGDDAFTSKYGGSANAYGKCVSQSH